MLKDGAQDWNASCSNLHEDARFASHENAGINVSLIQIVGERSSIAAGTAFIPYGHIFDMYFYDFQGWKSSCGSVCVSRVIAVTKKNNALLMTNVI